MGRKNPFPEGKGASDNAYKQIAPREDASLIADLFQDLFY